MFVTLEGIKQLASFFPRHAPGDNRAIHGLVSVLRRTRSGSAGAPGCGCFGLTGILLAGFLAGLAGRLRLWPIFVLVARFLPRLIRLVSRLVLVTGLILLATLALLRLVLRSSGILLIRFIPRRR